MITAFEEAFNLLCGDLIGEGCSRRVFTCRLMPGYVVKVEEGVRSFENIAEWMTWQAVVGTPASRWFAECKEISPDGKLLIMQRTRPPSKNEMPTEVPVWCSDLKLSNWGFASDDKGEGRRWVVCHDYGALSSKVLERGTSNKRLMKADWIDG